MKKTKNNLYSILGVSKSADKKSIKQAYRRAVKKFHPDVGGNAERFFLVKKSYDILNDDDRRKKYDETGDESEKSIDNSYSAAVNVIALVFSEVLAECANSGTSPLEIDVVSSVRKKINALIEEYKKNIRISRTMLGIDQKMNGRFKTENKENVFNSILENRITSLNVFISNQEEGIKNSERALEIIQGVTFDKDPSSGGDKVDLMMRLMGSYYV